MGEAGLRGMGKRGCDGDKSVKFAEVTVMTERWFGFSVIAIRQLALALALVLTGAGGLLGCAGEAGSAGDSLSSDRSSSAGPPAPPGGSNVSVGGSQDTGFLRSQLEAWLVPTPAALDAAGFFAEHHIELPAPSCGARVCVQPMLAVMSNLIDGSNCTLLHLGLNSPLEADPRARPPLSLVVVVDVSGSMQGQKIQLVREGLELLIDGMKDGDQLSIVTYSDAAELQAPLAAVEDQRAELRRIARALVAEGGTNLAAGLEAGYRELTRAYDGSRQNRVILLSDGQPTAGITDTASILALSRGYNSDGIGLTTIGLGSDFNIELMRGLAQQADGNFYFLEDVAAVSEVFQEELSFFVVPVAFNLELSVEAGADYDFGRALGTPFWTNSARGGRLDVPSVFLAHRDSDDDITEDEGRRGGGSSLLVELMPRAESSDQSEPVVATLELVFRDPETDELVSDQVAVSYPYPANVLQARGHFDAPDPAAIQKSFVMLNVFVGIERVVMEFHSNRAGARTLNQLDNLIAAVSDYNEEVGDKDLELDLELLDLLRRNLVRAGVPDARAGVSADPWPAD
jgi:Ca-activated chloride channel family protein